jgi:hypothetical protein
LDYFIRFTSIAHAERFLGHLDQQCYSRGLALMNLQLLFAQLEDCALRQARMEFVALVWVVLPFATILEAIR